MDSEHILECFHEASRHDEKLKELIRFISNKDDFLQAFSRSDESTAAGRVVEILCAVENAVSFGKLAALQSLCAALEWISSPLCHTIENTNLIILACKGGNTEILKWLLANMHVVQLLSSRPVSLANEDGEGHTAIYYAIRSSCVDLLHCLSADCTDELLSTAYWELLTNNVSLTVDMRFYVQNRLINLRYSINNKINARPKDIEQRINWFLDKNKILQTEYLQKPVNARFLHIVKFMALNIRFLKEVMRSTNTILPWEELEFCLEMFVFSREDDHELNIFYLTVIKKETLLQYLDCFSKLLDSSKELKLQTSGRPDRDEVVANIIKANPSFQNLYDDYYEIKNVYSLYTMKTYLMQTLFVEKGSRKGQLLTKRALQVVGEHLKNTMDSPNLSEDISNVIVLTAPTATRQILTALRNAISHIHTIDDANWKSVDDFISKDCKKIYGFIREILYSEKLNKIKDILFKISMCKNSEEMNDFAELFQDRLFHNVVDSQINNCFTYEITNISNAILELSDEVPNKTPSEVEMFKEMKSTLNRLRLAAGIDIHVLANSYGIETLKVSAFRTHGPEGMDMFLERKSLARDLLHALKLRFRLVDCIFTEIKNLLNKCYDSAEIRLTPDLTMNFIVLLCKFDNFHESIGKKNYFTKSASFVKQIVIKLNKNASTAGLDVKKCKTKSLFKGNDCDDSIAQKEEVILNQLDLNVSELQSILKNDKKFYHSGDIFLLKCFSNRDRLLIEILMLDIMLILKPFDCLGNNALYLNNPIPLLSGVGLRNHLAHGNILMQLLFPNTWFMLLSNAKKLTDDISLVGAKEFIQKKYTPVIQNVDHEIIMLYAEGLRIIEERENMYLALEKGDLCILKICIRNGAEVHSRSSKSWGAAHHAARAPSEDALCYLLACGVNIQMLNDNGQSALHIAAASGREKNIQFLVERCGLQLDAKDCAGLTPLHAAAQNGQRESVETLLRLGASISIYDDEGYFPLHYSVKYNHLSIVQKLIEKDCDMVTNFTADGSTALHLASKFGFLELVVNFIAKNFDVNSKDDKDRTPIHMAALNGHVEIVDALINAGAYISPESLKFCASPLFFSAEKGHKDVVEKLLNSGAPIDGSDDFPPLCIAARNGHKEVVEILVREGANVDSIYQYSTSLLLATSRGHLDIVRILLDNQCNENIADRDGFTALHISISKGYKDLVVYFANKLDKEVKSKEGYTPLHTAVMCRNLELVNILLDNGANVNNEANTGKNSLYFSVDRDDYSITETLLKRGATVNLMTLDYISPMHLAVVSNSWNCDILDLLLKYGADIDMGARCKPPQDTPLHTAASLNNVLAVEALVQRGANVNAANFSNETPLITALINEYMEVVNILLANKCIDVNIGSIVHSPLNIAISKNLPNTVKDLIAAGANVNSYGGLPLITAIIYDHKAIVEILLKDNNIDVNTKFEPFHSLLDSSSFAEIITNMNSSFCVLTPLLVAIETDRQEFVKMLLSHGAKFYEEHLEHAISKGNVTIIEELKNSSGKIQKPVQCFFDVE